MVQAWDPVAAAELAREYLEAGFDGVAIGGLVPRLSQVDLVESVVAAVRTAAGPLPLHAFGIGHPDQVARMLRLGVDSVDSSSYVKYAASGQLYSAPHIRHADLTPHERVHLALCNLAAATGKTLPLPTARFSTLSVRTLTESRL
ncbi:hypothetical protein DESA109040_23025 [Deinococcus saxicola]